MRLLVLLLASIGLTLALASSSPASAPVRGPGAVVSMHRSFFKAVDAGQTDTAMAFLHADMQMDDEYRRRPCQIWLVGTDGEPRAAQNQAQSRELLSQWIEAERASGASYKTKITPRAADCFSAELSFAVLDIERSCTRDGETTVERWRSTSLVTYDSDWKLTHMHISPAE
jgi:hypothetical protein